MIRRDLITTAFSIVVSAFAAVAQPSLPSTFKAQTVASPEGADIFVRSGGAGPVVVLLHGYAETSDSWAPLAAELAKSYTVVVPDLRGAGGSAKPASGYDKKNMAVDIHDLTASLGLDRVRIVGHDIGLMVAYAYAAQFPAETEKLVVMDAFLPGVAEWESVYNSPNLWHFRFSGKSPEALVAGRERTYYDYYWNEFAADRTRSIPEADRKAYVAAYSRPGRMHAGWAYFQGFPQTARDFAELSRTRLSMPVLSIGGEKANGEVLGRQMKLVASDVTVVVLKDTGHWLMEERPSETIEALNKFL